LHLPALQISIKYHKIWFFTSPCSLDCFQDLHRGIPGATPLSGPRWVTRTVEPQWVGPGSSGGTLDQASAWCDESPWRGTGHPAPMGEKCLKMRRIHNYTTKIPVSIAKKYIEQQQWFRDKPIVSHLSLCYYFHCSKITLFQESPRDFGAFQTKRGAWYERIFFFSALR